MQPSPELLPPLCAEHLHIDITLNFHPYDPMRQALDSRLEEVAGKDRFSFPITHLFPSSGTAFYLGLSKRINKYGPQLILTENYEQALQFRKNINFWLKDLSVKILPQYDPPLYAGVQLSRQQVFARLSWLHSALHHPNESIFVAPIMGLMQKTLPKELFFDRTLEFSTGDSLPDDFFTILSRMGYHNVALVEDPGSIATRGGIIDIYSPQMPKPIRLELFDNEIESMRYFEPTTQRTLDDCRHLTITPAREVLFDEESILTASEALLKHRDPEMQNIANHLRRNEYSENLEYYLPLFYKNLETPLSYFEEPPLVWWLDPLNIETAAQNQLNNLQSQFKKDQYPVAPENIFSDFIETKKDSFKNILVNKVQILDSFEQTQEKVLAISVKPIAKPNKKKFNEQIISFLQTLENSTKNSQVFVAVRGRPQYERVRIYLEEKGFRSSFIEKQDKSWNEIFLSTKDEHVFFVEGQIEQSFSLPSEDFTIISFEEFFGRSYQREQKQNSTDRGKHLSFGEITEGDFVVHATHGVCQFMGLTTMPVMGMDSEFLTLQFKGKDKLFLPIYRIHQIYKYSSEKSAPPLDKLGGSKWTNVKTKTKRRLREIAHELVALYAKRKEIKRPPYDVENSDSVDFFNAFPYEETTDQMKAIEDVCRDLEGPSPMDRLICGDVGFGKTEVAMRAAFVVARQKKQVAILAPTTILTMQHLQTFQKRFKDWPLKMAVVNRLQSSQKNKETLLKLKNGEIDILVGTHRILSKDVEFSNLGLLIVDEEQKFGVGHKEKIKTIKTSLDTLALSATPIPRTLNMSLLGIRDLSIINTAPVDRLETRTFVCKYDKEIIKRAIESELERGGQVFFLHNKVQSIYTITEELRSLMPKIRIGVGHGQMKETQLESTMISFFKNDLDVLVCSTIIESGIDIPNANTIIINNSENFGLSQLYQLRGRVGRSGRRAYCYLLTENHKKLSEIAKERLRVIQENTALGSGLQIAHYDLELRGSGTLLGEEQSGVIDSVGYEFYMELLDEAIKELKGEEHVESIEPDINLRIKAFIPHSYMPNIRLRLSYYRALTQIKQEEDVDDLEEELRDQFGKPPEEVINLLGLMLIRYSCIQLGVKDISSGRESLILSFTESTLFPPQKAIELATQDNKKYSLTPDNRLKIRLKDIVWPKVYDEVSLLLKYCP